MEKQIIKQEESSKVNMESKSEGKTENDSDNGKFKKLIESLKNIAGLGLILIVVKNILKGGSEIVVKKLTGINPITLLMLRSLVSLSLATPLSISMDQPPFPPGYTWKERLVQLIRCVFACLQGLANYYALQQMPLAVAKMIISTKPLFTAIFARIFLGENIDFLDVFNMFLMMGGAVTAIQPWRDNITDTKGYEDDFFLSSILLLAATGLGSTVSIILRKFRKQSVMSLTLSREIVYVIMTFSVVFPLDLHQGILDSQAKLFVLFLGCMVILTQSLNILALKFEEASKVAVMDRCSSMIIAVLSQIIVFHDLPDSVTWIGFASVSVAILIMAAKKLGYTKLLSEEISTRIKMMRKPVPATSV